MMPKPDYLSVTRAATFKASNVAECYVKRPDYSAEVYEVLFGLIPRDNRVVLDAGCGPGKIARGLVDRVERVDAIDFSQEMIRVGQSLPNGTHPHLQWQCAAMEEAILAPSYGLVVAGASLHWMDWDVVLPRIAAALHPGGYLALVDGDGPIAVPWLESRTALIAEYSSIRNYRPFSSTAELTQRGHFEKVGEKRTEAVLVKQTIADFLKSEHSRHSLATAVIGPARSAEFDAKMRSLLEPYQVDGQLHYFVSTRLVWGYLQLN